VIGTSEEDAKPCAGGKVGGNESNDEIMPYKDSDTESMQDKPTEDEIQPDDASMATVDTTRETGDSGSGVDDVKERRSSTSENTDRRAVE